MRKPFHSYLSPLSAFILHPTLLPTLEHRIHFSRGMLFYTHMAKQNEPRGWVSDIKLPTFDRISDCTGLEFHGGEGGRLNGIPLKQREGHRRKGLYIPPSFRGWSIRLRGKISIRNDIERLIRKGWNPFAFELDRCSLHCRDSFLSFLFSFFFFFGISYVWKLSAVVFWSNWDDYYDGI